MRIFLLLSLMAISLFLQSCADEGNSIGKLERLCKDGVAEKCSELAFKHSIGSNKNIEQAEVYSIRAYNLNKSDCENDNVEACGRLGRHFQYGEGTEKSIPRAIEAHNQACEFSIARSCESLGHIFSSKSHKDTEKSNSYFVQARRLFDKECKTSNPVSCARLSGLLRTGSGGPVNEVGSFDAAQRSCEISETKYCELLAPKYLLGKGVKQDKLKAAEIFHEACIDGSHMACYRSGYLTLSKKGILKNHPKEAEFYELRCNAKHGGACFMLSRFYIRAGENTDEEKSEKLALKSCQFDSAVGCYFVAISSFYKSAYSQSPKLKKESKKFAKRGCDLGNEKACELYSTLDSEKY